MSNPNNEQNPWTSLAGLLSPKEEGRVEKVATLATAIEKEGIYTWDRFGRMVKAPKGDGSDPYSETTALDLLALVYKNGLEAQDALQSGCGDQLQHELDMFIEDYQSPLVRFGWPSEQCPDFSTYKPSYAMPDVVTKAGQPDEDGVLGKRERTSLDTIIRTLMKMAKLSMDQPEPYKLAGVIAKEIQLNEEKLSENTIAHHLKRIIKKG